MAKQILGCLPFVASKLPGLTRGEDSYNSGPVFGFELVGGVDDDETLGFGGFDGGDGAGYVDHVGVG